MAATQAEAVARAAERADGRRWRLGIGRAGGDQHGTTLDPVRRDGVGWRERVQQRHRTVRHGRRKPRDDHVGLPAVGDDDRTVCGVAAN